MSNRKRATLLPQAKSTLLGVTAYLVSNTDAGTQTNDE
jgi:hypothetical protein